MSDEAAKRKKMAESQIMTENMEVSKDEDEETGDDKKDENSEEKEEAAASKQGK